MKGSGVFRCVGVEVLLVVVLLVLCAACTQTEPPSEDVSQAEGEGPTDFFGQEPPGASRAVFAPGIVSTIAQESGLTVSPDGRDVVFSVGLRGINVILLVSWESGHWGEPRVAPFSGLHNDWEPVFSPSGHRLYFISTRPTENPDGVPDDRNLWYVERTDAGWGEPVEVGPPVNAPDLPEGYASITQDGHLYFDGTDLQLYEAGRAGSMLLATLLCLHTAGRRRMTNTAASSGPAGVARNAGCFRAPV